MIIELNGTGNASFGERARKLIAEGRVPEGEELVWTRGGVPVGTKAFSAALWANTQVIEAADGKGMKFRAIDPAKPHVRLGP